MKDATVCFNRQTLLAELLAQVPDGITSKKSVKAIRLQVRQTLGTWPDAVPFPQKVIQEMVASAVFRNNFFDLLKDWLIENVQSLGEIFVGMADGPFLLAFRPQNQDQFITYAEQNPSHKVKISWTYRDGQEKQWTIQPVKNVENVENEETYTLSFGLPQNLADWIFSEKSGAIRRAADVKETYLKNIVIYRYTDGQDHLYRLIYEPMEMPHGDRIG